ncbi:MAG TPA: cytochrome ubiquinol oxidase subunit I [Longimicrobiales bacterium]|nr:cytochrome ubiquinol oxidase subunit I [Longimicrobiales bacterium]
MDVLTAARLQMEVSLGFHMIFAALGIGMPLLMLIAEWRWLRTGQAHYRALAQKWAKATALTFAVGAVSGTALSFELGLLWPRFMALAGGVLGPAFALEGYAFFIEAIFLGLYLYGWDRLTPRAHWWAGVPIAVSGLASGVLVVAANAWMQAPADFEAVNGRLTQVDPLSVFSTPAWFHLALHSSLSCYIATGFAVAGVYALGMLRGRRDAYHRSGLDIALLVGGIAAVLQPLSGDLSARRIAEYQPAKLAAMEAHYETSTHVPLLIGGIPDGAGGVKWALRIPSGLSLLVGHDPATEITGLNAFPEDERPPVGITHVAFQVMVGCGVVMAALAIWFAWRRRRGDVSGARLLLRAIVLASPLGYIALEAGWIVTEVGRQPWVIYGVMRTADGVTPVSDVPYTLFGFTVLYLALGTALAWLLLRLTDQRYMPADETTYETPEGAA